MKVVKAGDEMMQNWNPRHICTVFFSKLVQKPMMELHAHNHRLFKIVEKVAWKQKLF